MVPPSPSPHRSSLQWGRSGLKTDAVSELTWLWQGYLALGALTLLTSRWKTGKTTLVSVLLARMKRGGLLAGLPVASAKALVLTEESSSHWLARADRLGLHHHVGWYCRPFLGRPSLEQWHHLLQEVDEVARSRTVSLIVIDPLASFFPGKSESSAAAMLDVLAPLQRLAAAGRAVLVLHHPAKKEEADSPSGRGSGALLGYADILIEMRPCRRGVDPDRRRRLLARSRFSQTPAELVIELNADATDYQARGSFADEEFAAAWRLLEGLLAQADAKLSHDELLAAWPAPDPPAPATLYRWLHRAVHAGLLRCDGRGRRRYPYRYWLPQREEFWRRDPLAFLRMPEL